MSKTNAPYEWHQIETDLRLVLAVTAKALGTFGIFSAQLYLQYLGIEDDADFDINSDMDRVDLTRHRIYMLARRYYSYAYQLDGYEDADEDDWYEASALLSQGLPENTADGTESPLRKNSETPLRIMMETFFARFKLNKLDASVSIQELALLANMTVPAVRSSLSKEGFKLERGLREDDEGAQLSSGDSLRWLSRRRGFIPNRGQASGENAKLVIRDLVFDSDMDFAKVVVKIAAYLQPDLGELARAIGREEAWVDALMRGEKADIDIDALRKLAIELDAPEAKFVGRMVTHLLS